MPRQRRLGKGGDDGSVRRSIGRGNRLGKRLCAGQHTTVRSRRPANEVYWIQNLPGTLYAVSGPVRSGPPRRPVHLLEGLSEQQSVKLISGGNLGSFARTGRVWLATVIRLSKLSFLTFAF